MSKKFNKLIESTIEDYAKAVSAKFNIPRDELMDIWYGNTSNSSDKPIKILSSTTKAATKSDIDFESDSEEETKESIPKGTQKTVQKSKSSSEPRKDENSLESLKRKAKELGIPGISKFKASNKDELVELIEKAEKGGSTSSVKKTKSPPKKPVVKEEPKVTTEYVQKKLASFSVSKNTFGNFWNESSGLVFDKVSRQAIGKQQPNGDVTNLTKQDIEFCKNNNISYKLPTNIISEEKEQPDESEDESVDDDEDEFDEDELSEEDN